MNTLLRHIEYLISRNDCVIIPGFGAVLAKNVSACYDGNNHTIMPPQRIFTFNSDMCHDDDMLAASIQRAEGISHDEALEIVNASVREMLNHMQNDGHIALGLVGDINIDAETGAMTFTENAEARLCTETIWLNELALKPLVEETGDNVIEAPIKKRQYSPLKRFVRAAASIVVLLGVGFVASTPMPVDDAMLASLAPDVYKIDQQEIVPERDDAVALTVALPIPGTDSVIKVDEIKKQNATAYYVIVASLATYDEAQKYLSYHPGQGLEILDMGKHYSIYSSMHDDVYEAYRTSLQTAKIYPDAWVCKK